MKLKLTRSQRSSMTGKNIFHLDVVMDISDEEFDLIKKYKLEKQVVYSSETCNRLVSGAQIAADIADNTPNAGSSILQSAKSFGLGIASRFALTVSVKDMINGKAIECKDLVEMTEAEQAVITGGQNLKTFIETAQTFDGRELVVEL